MKAHIKDAVITAALVLAVIYAGRKVPVVGPLINTALVG